MRTIWSGCFPAIILLFCLFFFTMGTAFSSPFTPVDAIILDAGHGGHDPGAVSVWDDVTYYEKDIVLDIVLRMKAILGQRAPDLNVILTRDSDVFVSLEERAGIAVDSVSSGGASGGTGTIFVSLHVNSARSASAQGYEILIKQADRKVTFLDEKSPLSAIKRWSSYKGSVLNTELNKENKSLASSVRASLATFFPAGRDRGIIERDIYVLNYSRMPSVLVEMGFLSNKDDAWNLRDGEWRQKMAAAIVSGLLAYRFL